MQKKVIENPTVHLFEDSGDAYDSVNCGVGPDGAEVKDGDVLVVASEGIIGVATSAWPVAAVLGPDNESGAFHTLATDADVSCLFKADEKSRVFRICPPGEEAFDQETIFPANPGVDYTASFRLARETAVSDADITGNEHWKEQ